MPDKACELKAGRGREPQSNVSRQRRDSDLGTVCLGKPQVYAVRSRRPVAYSWPNPAIHKAQCMALIALWQVKVLIDAFNVESLIRLTIGWDRRLSYVRARRSRSRLACYLSRFSKWKQSRKAKSVADFGTRPQVLKEMPSPDASAVSELRREPNSLAVCGCKKF